MAAAPSRAGTVPVLLLLVLLVLASCAAASPNSRLVRRQAMRKYNRTNIPDGFLARPGVPGTRAFGSREFAAPGNDSAGRYLQKPYNICISDWAPMVQCKGIEDPFEFTGYQVEMFRYMAEDFGWLEGEDFQWHCMGWSEMIADLIEPEGSCFVAAAGVEVTMPNLELGLKFSAPIYKTGLQAMIYAPYTNLGNWAFANVFTWDVWLILGITGIGVALLMWGLEKYSKSAQEYYEKAEESSSHHRVRNDYSGWTWYSVTKLMYITNHVGDPRTWASRFLVLAYGFLVMIMLHIYTAGSAVQLTQTHLATNIHSIEDLSGKAVVTWSNYVNMLAMHGVESEGHDWEDDHDVEHMVHGLHEKKYDALILDYTTVVYLAATDHHCETHLLGNMFETYNLAIAFAPDAPEDLIMQFSVAIVRMQEESSAVDLLESLYIKAAAKSHCGGSHGSGGHGVSYIKFGQVAGLWIILGMVGAFALLLVGFQSLWLWHEHKEDIRHGTSLSRQSTMKVLRSLGGKSSTNLGARSSARIAVIAEPSRRSSSSSELNEVSGSEDGEIVHHSSRSMAGQLSPVHMDAITAHLAALQQSLTPRSMSGLKQQP